MATTIVMPQMGYDMQEGSVVRWLKQEGEEVKRGEILAEIETDKAVVEMESFTAGVVRKLLVEPGVTVPVGQAIAVIGTADEPLPEDLGAGPAAAPAAEQPKAQASAARPAAKGGPAEGEASAVEAAREIKATPIARRIARERGVDLQRVKGTGPGGRITEADVSTYVQQQEAAVPEAAAAPAPAAPGQRVELTRMRQTIARHTAQSKREIPHFYVTMEIDMTAAMEMRRQVNERLGEELRVTVNDIIVKAAALALEKFPRVNATFREDHLQLNSSLNIGIAVDLEEGLLVPAILDCQQKSLVEIAQASKELVERARQGKLKAEEYTAGTFSISNLGMLDVDSFAAIILPPQAAVLAVGSVKSQPVVRDGNIQVAEMMKATIAVDHRVADGAEAARFLAEIKRLLESPAGLLV